MSWTIRRGAVTYEVTDGEEKRETVLLADTVEVDRQTAGYWESSTLTDHDTTIKVQWGPRNTITTCALTDAAPTSDATATAVPLTPPPGSRAARREAFARDHPVRFVAGRAAVAGAEIAIGILGVSALVTAFVGQLMPRIDMSWIPHPSLPDIDLPGWLRYADPSYWLTRLDLSWPDVTLPGWLDAVLEHKRYWLPVVIAVLIALGELDRRRRRDADRGTERDEDDEQP